MYLLNNDKLKDRNPFWTWLFLNKKLKNDCRESIRPMVNDMDKLHEVERRAHETKDIKSELKIATLVHGMNQLYLDCVKCGYKVSRLSYSNVVDIVLALRALDELLSKGEQNV